MNKENIMSEEEFKEYENIEVSDELVEKIKENSKDSFYKEMFMESLNKFKGLLDEDEFIENYIVGFNYTDNAMRALTSLGIPWLSNPMFFEWTSYSIIIKTNKKLYIADLDMFNKFIKKVEVEDNFYRYTKNKKNIYIKLNKVNEDNENTEKVIIFNKDNINRVDEFFKECRVNIINKKYIESVNIAFVIEIIIVIIAVIIVIKRFNLIRFL